MVVMVAIVSNIDLLGSAIYISNSIIEPARVSLHHSWLAQH